MCHALHDTFGLGVDPVYVNVYPDGKGGCWYGWTWHSREAAGSTPYTVGSDPPKPIYRLKITRKLSAVHFQKLGRIRQKTPWDRTEEPTK
jgi:hypothetical protein